MKSFILKSSQNNLTRSFHTAQKTFSAKDYNLYQLRDRQYPWKELRDGFLRPVYSAIENKEKKRLAAQEKIDVVTFVSPPVPDEFIMHVTEPELQFKTVQTLPIERSFWPLPYLPLPAISKRDAAGCTSGCGRRKTARAVAMIKPGKGMFTVNGRNFCDYFPHIFTRSLMLEPVIATETYNRIDATIKVRGGGFSGQAQAIRQALANALLRDDPENRFALQELIKSDFRRKERKKTGLKKARKRPQWKKR